MIKRRMTEIVGTVLEKAMSATGRHDVFLAEHMDGDAACYDVGVRNLRNGAVSIRHYKDRQEAFTDWETMAIKLTGCADVHNERAETDLSRLSRLLMQCQSDTLEILGAGAASRLAHWHKHADDLGALIQFIRDRIHGIAKANGWELHNAERLSLERIVIEYVPHLFSNEDIQAARETLGLTDRI